MQKQSQSKAQNNIDRQMRMELEKLFMSSSSGSDQEDSCKRQFEEENKPVNSKNTEFIINTERENVDAIRYKNCKLN